MLAINPKNSPRISMKNSIRIPFESQAPAGGGVYGGAAATLRGATGR